MNTRRILVWFFLSLLVVSTVATGLYFKHYFVVTVFGVWICIELFLTRLRGGVTGLGFRFSSKELVLLLENDQGESWREMEEHITRLDVGTLTPYEKHWIDRLRNLMEIKDLHWGNGSRGRKSLRQLFAYRRVIADTAHLFRDNIISIQDITESATVVADLYWRLFDCCQGNYPELTPIACNLYEKIVGKAFELDSGREFIETLVDSIQRDGGLSYLILKSLFMGDLRFGRHMGQELIRSYEEATIDDDIKSALYWVSEIVWFNGCMNSQITDYEACIRHLYHLCFTNPERAGFLEIDSQFFSQFSTVNEIAREGFLYKEVLVEKILRLWGEHEGLFEEVFRGVMESITRQKSKIFDDRNSWELFWHREKSGFCREHLHVVEGNLSYASGLIADARVSYEKALSVNPCSRSALLNLTFVFAKLGDISSHAEHVARLIEDKTLYPSSLYVIGDSLLLLGDEAGADRYYESLKEFEGWERKVDYYKSTFCYENALYGMALAYAKKAFSLNPHDSAISFHLSLCYNAMGEKDKALEIIKKVGNAPQWVNYYKFTLQRDIGEEKEASETLLGIPSDYFDDSDELEGAVNFARKQKDLALLRHLRRKD